jgi:large subunit ribosomal protein L31
MTRHPDLHLIDVRCSSCGTSFTTHSTATKLSVDVCSACHPAYTGRGQSAANSGRIDRFNQRRALATA